MEVFPDVRTQMDPRWRQYWQSSTSMPLATELPSKSGSIISTKPKTPPNLASMSIPKTMPFPLPQIMTRMSKLSSCPLPRFQHMSLNPPKPAVHRENQLGWPNHPRPPWNMKALPVPSSSQCHSYSITAMTHIKGPYVGLLLIKTGPQSLISCKPSLLVYTEALIDSSEVSVSQCQS